MGWVTDDWSGETHWEDEIDYNTRPDLAPPGSVWNPSQQAEDDGLPGAETGGYGGWDSTDTPQTLDPFDEEIPPPPSGTPQPLLPQQQDTFQSPSFNDQRPNLPNRADFRSPNPLAPWTGQFTAPTLEEATNTPGFQFRLGEGLKALQRSAAAKGTLLTGGTLKGLMSFGQDMASQEYGNVYNRKQGEYEGERTNFLQNEANRYTSERGNLNDQWGIESGYFDMGRSNRLDDFNIYDRNRGFDFNVFDSGRNFGRLLNNDYWGQNMDLARLGQPRDPYA